MIPLYNHERYISKALESVFTQTRSPTQIVIVDDGSTDRSADIAERVAAGRAEIHRGGRNLGGPHTMMAAELCSGEFIAVLNSDDAWTPEKLARQVEYLQENPRCGVVFSRVRVIDEDDELWGSGSNPFEEIFSERNRSRHEWLRHFFHNGNAFCASSALLRSDCLREAGGFDGRYMQLQDLDTWLRIALGGYDIHVLDEPLTYYRVMRGAKNMSSSSLQTRSIFDREYIRILRSYWSLSLADLTRVFPDITIHPEADDRLSLFYLAQYAAQQNLPRLKRFAVETMQEWGGDLSRAQMAYECHGFTRADYANFLSQGDRPYRKGLAPFLRWCGDLLPLRMRFLVAAHLKGVYLAFRSRE